jgi:hypothetical protein
VLLTLETNDGLSKEMTEHSFLLHEEDFLQLLVDCSECKLMPAKENVSGVWRKEKKFYFKECFSDMSTILVDVYIVVGFFCRSVSGNIEGSVDVFILVCRNILIT